MNEHYFSMIENLDSASSESGSQSTSSQGRSSSGSGKDPLGDGLVELLKPAVEEVDERVKAVRESQVELRQQIDIVSADLRKIQDTLQVPVELDSYVKKLNNARRRVMLVNNILQNSQERLGKLHQSVSKETAKRKALLDPPSPGPPT